MAAGPDPASVPCKPSSEVEPSAPFKSCPAVIRVGVKVGVGVTVAVKVGVGVKKGVTIKKS